LKPFERPAVSRVCTTYANTAAVRYLVEREIRAKAQFEFIYLSTVKSPEAKSDEAVQAFRDAIEKGMLPVIVLSPHAVEGKIRDDWIAWLRVVHHNLPGMPIIDLTSVPLFYSKQMGKTIDLNAKSGQDLVMAGFEAGLLELRARIAFGLATWPVAR
ncbi:MAG: hypothetical protein H0V44_12500, partial [Planctomycetes bacterium]|nr:hypothetical protein [Planctomycetota bacterium]